MGVGLLVAWSISAYLFFILPAAGSVLLVYGIFQVIMETGQGERRRLEQRLRGGSGSKVRESKEIQSILRREAREEAKDIIGQTIGRLSFIPKVQVLLDQANVDWSASRMMANLFGAAGVVLVGLLMFGFDLLTAAGCGGAIVLVPLMYLSYRRRNRMKKLTYQLPEVFEMMSQALRAGHSLAGSIQLIHEQMPDPIAREFGRVFHEQNLGIKIEDALLSMADRVDSLDVRFFVTAVLIQRTTGGDLAEVLDKISGLIRQRIELYGMVQALTAEGRLSGWVLFGLPVVAFLAAMFLSPGYAETMLYDPRGKMMLFCAGGMALMGIAMIRWIVNIKV
ncbi:MAG: type II secretion system F family protein [Phycisphaerales bacterium]|nr:MAG: type II secretion system F family protein [Phycisphaerales bacterium]